MLLLLLASLFIETIQAQLKVACIGNSITAGYGLKKGEAYPEQLQILLGSDYEVHNYGISSRTLLKKGDHPYASEKMYRDALEWLPDIVIIKLGTNDSKPENWKYSSEFVNDYLDLVNSFKLLASHPKVFVCFPLPVFEAKWGINDSTMRNAILPMIKKVRKKTKSGLIDLYHPFIGKKEMVFDGIHPTAEGSKLIAKEVYRVIK